MSESVRDLSKKAFQHHILIFERFLLETKYDLPGEQTVYLTGMLIRQNDASYRQHIRRFLFDSPEELDCLTRRHYLCLGQNAPVYFISRINAEYLTVKLLSRSEQHKPLELEKLIPTRYFEVASIYAYQSGNRTLGGIFAYIHKNYSHVLGLLCSYLSFLKESQLSSNTPLPASLWKRFSRVTNERNQKKERWESQRLSEKDKHHIHTHEFNQMINFSTPN